MGERGWRVAEGRKEKGRERRKGRKRERGKGEGIISTQRDISKSIITSFFSFVTISASLWFIVAIEKNIRDIIIPSSSGLQGSVLV